MIAEHVRKSILKIRRLTFAVFIVVALGVVILLPRPAEAAITILDPWPATAQINNVTSAPAGTSFTPSAGSNRIILISVHDHTNNVNTTTISASYGSNNVPARAIVNSPDNQRRQTWFFYLNESDIAAATGSTITVNNDNVGSGMSVYVAALGGVDQNNPVVPTPYAIYDPAVSYSFSVLAGGYAIFASTDNTSNDPTNDEGYTGNASAAVGSAFSYIAEKLFATAATTGPAYTTDATYSGFAAAAFNAASDPGELRFGSATYTVDENGGTATIAVSRANGTTGAVSVGYATSNGTATAGSDYTAASGTLSWADGETVDKTFGVTISDDSSPESTETINLALSSPTGGATLGTPSTATLSIVDNDGPGTLQFTSSSFSAAEKGGTATITVSRAGGTSGAVGISYSTADGTAAAGSDYTSASGTLAWADGDGADKTINIDITDDADTEGDETFTVSLASPTGGAGIGSPGTGTVTILDDEGPPVGTPAGNWFLFTALFAGMFAYVTLKNRSARKEM